MKRSHIRVLDDATARAMTVPFHVVAQSLAATPVPPPPNPLRAVLETFGCAIVTDVISPAVCAELEGNWADDLRSIIVREESSPAAIAPILADPIANWPSDELSLGDFFVFKFGLPQGRFAWAARVQPNVRTAFQALFGPHEELCCGTDTVFFSNRPSPAANDTDRSTFLWPHVDQNSHVAVSGAWEAYQSVLYIRPSTIDGSTTAVWPRSHGAPFAALMKSATAEDGHFYQAAGALMDEFVTHARRVLVPAGGLFLWNSRTMHQGWMEGARLAIPICYEPKSRRCQAALAAKIDCVKNGLPMTHWASLGQRHDGVPPDGWGPRGGTAAIPLAHVAHYSILTSDGAVMPEIMQWL